MMKVPYQVRNVCEPIPYASQKLMGFLGYRMWLNMEKSLAKMPYYGYLRAYDPGVGALWPSGEYLGKFAQALVYSYQYTGNQSFIDQIQIIIDTFIKAQERDGSILPDPGKYPTKARFNEWLVWNHKYTLLGMLEYYSISHGEERVLASAARLGDAMIGTYGKEKAKLDIMETYNTGMNGGSFLEPMTYLYQLTGEQKYLDFCNYILEAFEQENGPKIVSELTQGSGHVHKVGNGKGYEMLSCIIGILRMYQLTGEAIYLQTAEQAFTDIVENNLYISGTATQGEHFYGKKWLLADETDSCFEGFPALNMGEGCVTAHWMFLCRLLFQLSGDLKYIEEIEKSIYNHLLGSQSAVTGQQSYYTALIGHKQYMDFDAYGGMPPCCLSSVQRCIATIPETVWTKFTDNGFAVLMYDTAEFKEDILAEDGAAVNARVVMQADMMGTGKVSVRMWLRETMDKDAHHMAQATISANMPRKDKVPFRLALRVPGWCEHFEARVGGEVYKGTPGTYLDINRVWNAEESIDIRMSPRTQALEGSPTYAGYYAFKHGPYLLVLDQQLNPGIDIDKTTVKNPLKLVLKPGTAPEGWAGEQVYLAAAPGEDPLVLVPFLDAGQNGSKYRAWIPEGKP